MTLPILLALVTTLSSSEATPSWANLDAEIAELGSPIQAAPEGLTLNGHFRSFYTHDDSHVPGPTGGGGEGTDPKALNPNLSGFELESVRLRFGGSVEDISVALSMDVDSGTATLVDAYARWAMDPELAVTFGRFKQPFLNSQLIDESRLLFVKRTANAANFERREGLMVAGSFNEERGTWSATVDNGADGVSDAREYIGRVTYDLVGSGGFGEFEGGVVAGGETRATVGLTIADDKDDALGGRRRALELAATHKDFALHADLVDHADSFGGTGGTTGLGLAGTRPDSVTISYMVREDVELGWRYEDFDDTANTHRSSLVVNYYQVLPHRVKWSLSYEDTGSDDINVEERIFRAGLTLAF